MTKMNVELFRKHIASRKFKTEPLRTGTIAMELPPHISKGTAKVVTDLVNGAHRSQVAHLTVDSFTPLGIKELLTVQRQNGLGELINRIIRLAHD